MFITGASSGIGKVYAEFFLKKGANVIVCSRRNNYKNNIFKKSKKFYYIKFDLSKLSKIKSLVKIIFKKFKKVDILINNAGVAIPEKLDQLTISNLTYSFNVNFFAPSILTSETLKIMKKKNFGRIVNISSGGAVNCAETFFSYSSSKAALNTLAKTAAKEIKNYDIKINSMSPGPCKTEMFPNNNLSAKLSLPTLEYLCSLDSLGPTGKFFWFLNEINIFPDLKHINWNKPRKLKLGMR